MFKGFTQAQRVYDDEVPDQDDGDCDCCECEWCQINLSADDVERIQEDEPDFKQMQDDIDDIYLDRFEP